jgi:hypothetical protein
MDFLVARPGSEQVTNERFFVGENFSFEPVI